MWFELEWEDLDFDEDEVVNNWCLTFQREVKNKSSLLLNFSFVSLPEEDEV